ncbi:MAG: hypothetical protein ACLTZT_16675 [Butyricimonas faecalis]
MLSLWIEDKYYTLSNDVTDNVINIALWEQLIGNDFRRVTEDMWDIGTVERKCGRWEEIFYKGAAAFRLLSFRVGTFEVEDPVPISEAGPETRPYVERLATDIEYSAREKY